MSEKRSIGTVLDIFTAADKGEPMESHEDVYAIAGLGLAYDRYSEGKGAYSKSPRPAKRHVTFIAREDIAAANQELMAKGLEPFEPAETRRNILTEGLDLNQLVGRRIQIGAVALLGVELCTPCARPGNLVGRQGFKDAFQNRGGLRAEILTNGPIAVGGQIVVSPPETD